MAILITSLKQLLIDENYALYGLFGLGAQQN